MKEPLVSIVMPSLNQDRFIEASIESVLCQEYQNVELIVQDGGSTDNTLNILEKLSSSDNRISWLSSPDKGPANALNRALSRVRGEFIGWLNSDDIYSPRSIPKVIQAFANNPNWIMLYGNAVHFDDVGREIGPYPTRLPSVGIEEFRKGCFICQPTVFFKTALPVMIGPLDESLKASFDFDYWLKAFFAFGSRIGFLDTMLAKSRLHSECITQTMRGVVALEGMAIEYKYFGRSSRHWAITHLEELAEKYHLQKPSAFLGHANAFLNQARRYLGHAEIKEMQIELASF